MSTDVDVNVNGRDVTVVTQNATRNGKAVNFHVTKNQWMQVKDMQAVGWCGQTVQQVVNDFRKNNARQNGFMDSASKDWMTGAIVSSMAKFTGVAG